MFLETFFRLHFFFVLLKSSETYTDQNLKVSQNGKKTIQMTDFINKWTVKKSHEKNRVPAGFIDEWTVHLRAK